MKNLDLALFERIHSLVGVHPLLDAVMAFSSQYSPPLYAAILVLWLGWRREGQRAAGTAVSGALVALGIGQLLGWLFPRTRPFVALHFTPLLPHAVDPSLPSDHVPLAAAVAVVRTPRLRRTLSDSTTDLRLTAATAPPLSRDPKVA